VGLIREQKCREVPTLLASLAACAFLSLGAGAFLAPQALSENFGLPVDDAKGFAYVGSLGIRDAVLGLLIARFLVTGNRSALEATLGISALAGASDFLTVARLRGGAAASSLFIHGGGTIGLLGIWALVRSEGRDSPEDRPS
jgi:hypothetical protein